MKIAQALKEHLELNKEKFVQEYELQYSFGYTVDTVNFDMVALMKEIDVFCEAFKEKS